MRRVTMLTEYNIPLARNASYKRGWTMLYPDGVTPIDLTGWTFALDIKANDDLDGPVIASALIDNFSAIEGSFDVTIEGSDFPEPVGEPQIVRFAYDFIAKDATDVAATITRGQVVLYPGVSAL